MHILIVDDEELIRSVIRDYLEEENYTCDEADNGSKAIELVENKNYDLIIMDIMMPHMDGYQALREIKILKNIPVIMLSARTEEIDKLQGFSLGIDDYVTKPFSPKELIARIKAVTKRNGGNDTLTVGNITINNASREVMIDGELVDLTHTQFELLKLFLSNPSIALTRDKIIESIWGYDYEADDRTIDAHIKLLRSKLGKYRKSIKTIRKVGYRFVYEE
ncbi:MAG: response regulator transcription factor [Bacilli bacterium]|nr:response regulator transcription factor [Bacilli bacterium]